MGGKTLVLNPRIARTSLKMRLMKILPSNFEHVSPIETTSVFQVVDMKRSRPTRRDVRGRAAQLAEGIALREQRQRQLSQRRKAGQNSKLSNGTRRNGHGRLVQSSDGNDWREVMHYNPYQDK